MSTEAGEVQLIDLIDMLDGGWVIRNYLEGVILKKYLIVEMVLLDKK